MRSNAELQSVRIDNVKAPFKVQQLVSDQDTLTTDALVELKKKHNESYLSSILSTGVLGKDKKLVPTRWSITAVDDTLVKQEMPDILSYDLFPTSVYIGNYQGNYFLLLCIESLWSYELFEMHEDSNRFNYDYEFSQGRKDYAATTAGGYYATRLAIAQHCQKNRKQGAWVALRIITNEYYAPLGVWVVREAVRNACTSQPVVFNDLCLAQKYIVAYAKKKFDYDIKPQLQHSQLVKSQQSTLSKFY